jgi:hypothetical protein
MAVDLSTRIITAAVENWPLVAGIALSFYWLFPKMLKQGLLNGSGEVIRNIVRSENAEQTKARSGEMDRRFRKHEEQEDRRFQTIEEQVFRKSRR